MIRIYSLHEEGIAFISVISYLFSAALNDKSTMIIDSEISIYILQ